MNTKLEVRTVAVDRMKPARYNPRVDLRPGDEAYEKIKNSLHEFGYVDPIVWNDATGNIVGGHQRFKVLVEEGASEVECVVVHIEDANTEKALNVALNKAVGEWEDQSLAELLQDLRDSGYQLGVTGFDEQEIEEILSKHADKGIRDDNTELSAETIRPFVQQGDLWTLGPHRMLCGDATSTSDLARLVGDVQVNLIITDPPYNVGYKSADGKSIQNDSMEDRKFHAFLLSAFQNWTKHLAPGASVYIFHADTEGLTFRTALQEAGFVIAGVCIWVKNSLVLGRSPYQWQHEPVLFGWLPNGNHKWFGGKKQSSIWEYDRPKKSADHPTMKPIPLLVHPLQNSSEPNSVVLDTFGGSGSTLIACEQMSRVCYMMELDERYASVIVQRYINLVESDEEVSVLRNGQTFSYAEVVNE